MIHLVGGGVNLGYFVSIVKRDHPDWPRAAVHWQAQRMLDRHPAIQKAYKAGLDIGRELRQRMEHGLGVWWSELEPLEPDERGFVVAMVTKEIEPRKVAPSGLTLEDVKQKQEQEAYEQRADDLAADWQQKSDAPDKAVKAIKSFRA